MKRLGYGFLLVLSGLTFGCAVFLGGVSIWVGLSHQERDGSWVSILAGAFSIALFLFLFLRASAALYRRMKDPESIDL